MEVQVLKFGGTSVGSLQRIQHVARMLKKRSRKARIVAVLSAMAGETDNLMQMAHHFSNTPSQRELDVLLCTGEQRSIALMSICLQAIGAEAISLTAAQIGIKTDKSHTRARIEEINTDRIHQHLDAGRIVLVPGFQGVTYDGEFTTLGRGGSDTSAVAVAAALRAERCEIFTDVDGVYTTDPNIVPKASKLSKITFDEMLELASLGAKVLQTRSVEFGKNYNIPILVRSSFKDVPGTWVVKELSEMESLVVSGITYTKNEAKVVLTQMPDRVGLSADLFELLGKANLPVDVIVQNVSHDSRTDISFTCLREDLPRVLELLKKSKEMLGFESVTGDANISKVSVVGNGMRSHSGVAARMFRALSAKKINIQMISTSEIKISCVIDEARFKEAVQILHDEFQLDKIQVTEVNDFKGSGNLSAR